MTMELAEKRTLCLGLDIGTTTISTVVLDTENGSILTSRTVKHSADILSPHVYEKMQDAALIEQKAMGLVEELTAVYPAIAAIGLTGQMHGILYLDHAGNPLSPLYTWQDERAGLGSPSICDRLYDATGYRLNVGYGLATHCALAESGAVPAGAARLCTIMDYLAFVLCGRKNLKIHTTNAASLGLYDARSECFDASALERAGIDPSILPPVTAECEVLGTFRGIPVCVAVGDNQASVFGSVATPASAALANFGTGSQISVMTDDLSSVTADGAVEIRPYFDHSYLVCGSALCGGRAYALLEQFFRLFAAAAGASDEPQYALLNKLGAEGLASDDPLNIATTFCGTRADPELRGSITNLGQHNFTPAALTAGVLTGMAQELYQMFRKMPGSGISRLIASGNAIRKNPALVMALEQVFGLKVSIPAHQEEAAFGAALLAFAGSGQIPTGELTTRCIHYLA